MKALSRRRFLSVGVATGTAAGVAALGANVLAATPAGGPRSASATTSRPERPAVSPFVGSRVGNEGTIGPYDWQSTNLPTPAAIIVSPTLNGVYPSSAPLIGARIDVPSGALLGAVFLYGNLSGGTLNGVINQWAAKTGVTALGSGSLSGSGLQSVQIDINRFVGRTTTVSSRHRQEGGQGC